MTVTVSIRIEEEELDQIKELGINPSTFIRDLIRNELRKQKVRKTLQWLREQDRRTWTYRSRDSKRAEGYQMGVVFDTSVISKLFFNEKGTEEVLDLIDKLNEKDVVFHASDLILYEIGKVARKKMKQTEGSPSEYPNWVFGLEMHLHFPQMPLLKLANDLSSELDISFYDACHLAVAKKMKYPFITEDREILEKSDIAYSIEEVSKNFHKLFM